MQQEQGCGLKSEISRKGIIIYIAAHKYTRAPGPKGRVEVY